MDSAPLTREHYLRCQECLTRVAEIRAEIERAERIGLDLARLKTELAEIEATATAIKREYFPTLP